MLRLFSLLLLLFLTLPLALLLRPALGDYSLQVYSDPQCTLPYPGLPAVFSAGSGVVQNDTVCAPASQFTPLWLPSPNSAPAQWVVYDWEIRSDNGFQSLALAVYTYSSQPQQCPFNESTVTDNVWGTGANASLAFSSTSNRPCRAARYMVYDASTATYNTTYVYGNFTCTQSASSPNHAAPRLGVPASLLPGILLLFTLIATIAD